MPEYARMTKFERTKIIAERATQISEGAPIAIRTDQTDPVVIATEELLARKINTIVVRPNPNGPDIRIQVVDMILS